MWLSRLSASLQTKGSPVWFPLRAHAWVEARCPVVGIWAATTRWYWGFSPSLSPSLPLCLKINKYISKSFEKHSLNIFIFTGFKFLSSDCIVSGISGCAAFDWYCFQLWMTFSCLTYPVISYWLVGVWCSTVDCTHFVVFPYRALIFWWAVKLPVDHLELLKGF